MGTYDHGYDAILAEVHERFGFTPTIFNSGGYVMIFESRLDSSEFLWITDADCDVTPLSRRLASEADGEFVGWQVSIYPPDSERGPLDVAQTDPADTTAPEPVDADSCTRLASVTHHSATADQLPDLIELALRSRRHHEHHAFHLDGSHTISFGIEHY